MANDRRMLNDEFEQLVLNIHWLAARISRVQQIVEDEDSALDRDVLKAEMDAVQGRRCDVENWLEAFAVTQLPDEAECERKFKEFLESKSAQIQGIKGNA